MTEVIRFETGERVRHRRGWYGAVLADEGGDRVRVRFDDGTPPADVLRDALKPVDQIDAEVLELIASLGEVRAAVLMDAWQAEVLDRSIRALELARSEHSFRVRLAAEIDRMAEHVANTPFEKDVAKAPRVRQWFAAGARWALSQMRQLAQTEREATRQVDTK